MQEMIDAFSLEGCSKSAGIFNPDKLDWLNGHYIRQSKPQDLAPLVKDILKNDGVDNIDDKTLIDAVTISLEKVKTLKEMAEFIKLFFVAVEPDPSIIEKTINEETKPVLKRIAEEIASSNNVEHDTIHTIFEKIMAEFNLKMGKVANPVRVALSGQKISPGAYDLIRIFGKEESLQRIKKYL